MANVDLPAEAAVASRLWAQGIGLYRTEFLFLSRAEPPSEQEQYEVYAEIVRTTLPNTVTVRTIDMGGEALKGSAASPACPIQRSACARSAGAGATRTARRAAARRAARVGARPTAADVPARSGLKELRQARAALDLAREELRHARRNLAAHPRSA